jgi:hypothetical protein
MSYTPDGGPAFPRPGHYPEKSAIHPEDLAEALETINNGQRGMSLRDYFAGQALAALIGNRQWVTGKLETAEAVAHSAYLAADAMIQARNSPPVAEDDHE